MVKRHEVEVERRRLYRSSKDKMIFGVCGGLANYMHQDPTLIRIIAVLIIIFSGFFPGLIAYIIMAIIMPLHPHQ